MFPEGTRNLGKKELLPFKKGAFHLALSSRVPIQPVAVCRYKFLKKLSFENGKTIDSFVMWFYFGNFLGEIRIKILPAIPTDGYPQDDITVLMDKCHKVLSAEVDALSNDNNGCSNGKVISNGY